MRRWPTSNSWLFPPRTQELQLDEKWAFVFKKQKHCDLENLAEHHQGDCWDHLAYAPEHRLVLGLVSGKRSGSCVLKLLKRTKEQLAGRTPRLIMTDAFGPYFTAIELVFGNPPRPRPSGQGRKRPPDPPPPQVNHVTVCKQHKDGRVVKVETKAALGTAESVARALEASTVSTVGNVAFLERHNATDRHRNARKARKTYCFSKDWDIHTAVSCFVLFCYNFCWCVRTLSVKTTDGRRQRRTPAMAAELTDHIWSLQEWLERPMPGLDDSA